MRSASQDLHGTKVLLSLIAYLTFLCPAKAQHKLFFSDVLDRGQTEIEMTLSGSRSTQKLEFDAPSASRSASENRATYFIGWAAYGLANGVELGVAIPYFINSKTVTHEENGALAMSDSDGLGDIALRLKYLLLGNRDATGALAVRASLILDPTGNTTDAFAIGLYGSLRLGTAWRPYATMTYTARASGRSDLVSILTGIYYISDNSWFLDMGGTWNREGAESGHESIYVYSMQVTGTLALSKGWYARSGISAIRTDDFRFMNPDGRAHDLKGTVLFAGLYRLF